MYIYSSFDMYFFMHIIFFYLIFVTLFLFNIIPVFFFIAIFVQPLHLPLK